MLSVENFMKDTGGFNNWYGQFTLIGKDVTPKAVVNMLNKLYENDPYLDGPMNGKYAGKSDGWSMVSFTIGKETADKIYAMTEKLHCIGYAENPWADYFSIEIAKDGTRYDKYTAGWRDDSPRYRDEDMDDDYYDCFITVKDLESGFEIPTGQGAVDEETMSIISEFVKESKRKAPVRTGLHGRARSKIVSEGKTITISPELEEKILDFCKDELTYHIEESGCAEQYDTEITAQIELLTLLGHEDVAKEYQELYSEYLKEQSA